MFKVDYKASIDNELIPVGEYEVFVKDCFQNFTKGGTEYIDLQLQIREDIEQPAQKRRIFEKLWLSEKAKGFTYRIMSVISRIAGIPDGQEFADINELGAALKGKFMRVKVRHEQGNGDYPARERVQKWMETTAPEPMGDIEGRELAMPKGFVQVENGELPF